MSADVIPLKPEEHNPPVNLEAEQALLGAILVNSKGVLMNVRETITEEMFAEQLHGTIYKLALELDDRGMEATPVQLQTPLEHHPDISVVGGTSYLVRLAASAATVINAREYAQTIRDLFLRRLIMSAGDSFRADASDLVDQSASSIIEKIEDWLTDIHSLADNQAARSTHIEAVTASALEQIESACQHGKMVGVTTGLKHLDNLIGGLQKGQFVILGGRPKMGKTLFATNIARAAAQAGHGVLFFSLEMSSEQLATRMLTDTAHLKYDISIPYQRAAGGHLNSNERDLLQKAGKTLKGLPLAIDDTPNLSTSNMRLKVKRKIREMQKHGISLDLIIVDYLTLLTPGSRYKGNKVNEVSEITRTLKLLAKETGIPILCLSQLSRGVEQRDDKRPMLSDLRDSGSIEQDADAVLFCYREAYYRSKDAESLHPTDSQYEVTLAEQADLDSKVELICAAQRQGPTGSVKLHINLESGSIRTRENHER